MQVVPVVPSPLRPGRSGRSRCAVVGALSVRVFLPARLQRPVAAPRSCAFPSGGRWCHGWVMSITARRGLARSPVRSPASNPAPRSDTMPIRTALKSGSQRHDGSLRVVPPRVNVATRRGRSRCRSGTRHLVSINLWGIGYGSATAPSLGPLTRPPGVVSTCRPQLAQRHSGGVASLASGLVGAVAFSSEQCWFGRETGLWRTTSKVWSLRRCRPPAREACGAVCAARLLCPRGLHQLP